MSATDTLLTITVILLAIAQLAVLLVSIRIMMTLKKAASRWHSFADNMDKSAQFARQHLSKQWPVVSVLSWGIKKIRNGGTT